MELLRLLPIRLRLLLANLLLVFIVALGAYIFVPPSELPLFGITMLVAVMIAAVIAVSISQSITIPLTSLHRKLRESQEHDRDHVFRDRSSDEVGTLYRAVNDYVLYRDVEVNSSRRGDAPAPAVEKRELASATRELDNLGLLVEFGKLLSLNYDFGDAAHQVLERVNRHLQLEWSSVMVWDDEAREMRLAASVGLDPKLSVDVRTGTRPAVQFKRGEGVSGEVFVTGQPMVINKGHKDKRFKQFPKFTYSSRRINTLACVPLVHEGTTLGVANFVNITTPPAFGDDHVMFLARISEVLTFLLAKSGSYEHAFREATSGLYSTRYFHHLLTLEGERIRRKPVPLSLVKIAVQFTDPTTEQSFKTQTHGKIGELIRKTFRRVDRATREGDAFLISLPGTDPLGALFTAGRLKEQIDSFAFDPRDRQLFATSGGVAGYPDQVPEFASLLPAVDAALAEAQRIGDNRVVCVRPEMLASLRLAETRPSTSAESPAN
jgi:GGDEF domain-containing protein/HAMP domain-containing protein